MTECEEEEVSIILLLCSPFFRLVDIQKGGQGRELGA